MAAPTVYDGLRLYHKFDELAGPLSDSSGYRNSGVLANAGTVVSGKFGRALRTTTLAGNLTVAHDPSIAPLKLGTNGPLSISVWVNLDKGLATMWGAPTFASKLSGNSGYFFGCLSAGTNVLSFRVFNLAATAYTATYTEAATSGWVHYVCVYNAATVKIYRNGTEVASTAANGEALQNTAALTIGTGFEGLIDEFSLWSRNLSPAEVTALYNAGTGLELRQPALCSTEEIPFTDSPDTYGWVEAAVAALPAAADPALAPYGTPVCLSGDVFNMSSLPDPYVVVEKTKRIYINPHPNIVNVSIATDYSVTAIGNGGPTDATDIITWWQIELGPNEVFVIAARSASQGFQVNANQTDHFTVPRRQNWQGLLLSFWMQSAADADQMWSSAPISLVDDLWDHSGSGGETYPTIVDGLAALLVAKNSWTTTLTAAIDSVTSMITVGSVEGLHPAGGVLSIGDEVIRYASINTYGAEPVLLGCTRGYDGTLAAPHGAGVIVEARIVAAHHNRLVDAVRSLEGTVGVAPAADNLTGKTFANLQDRLNATLPYLIEKPLTADWSFTHIRGRVVSTQFWVLQDDGSYEQVIAPTRQKIDVNGTSTVTVTFDSPQTGFIVVN